MTPSISVVIRTYTDGRWHYLVDAVNSVLRQSLPPLEVILVVDHNPELAERVRHQWPRPDVVVVENQRTRGSSGTWNTGIYAARGDVIAFIDDDAVAEPTWLEELVVPYDQPDVVGVGGQIEPVWLEGKPAWFPEEFNWVVGCSYKGLPETTAPVRNLIGCNMSFRRSVLHEVGGLQEGSGLGHVDGKPVGCDETELCIRIHQQQPQAVMLHNPGAIVHHKVPPTRTTFRYFRERCNFEGQSKAVVAQLVGSGDGLSSERGYTLKTLPQGVLRGVSETVLRRDLGGIQRAGAIVSGLLITTTGYARRSFSVRRKRRAETPAAASSGEAYQPVHLLEIELSEPLPVLSARGEDGRTYQRARALIRLHTAPLGMVDLDLSGGGLGADACASRIWDELYPQIGDHLRQDGLEPVTGLTAAGLPTVSEPRCLHQRAAFLAGDPPFITVIVCTRDRADKLASCLPHIQAQEYPNFEILVVDNASKTRDTADLVQRLDVRYVREDRPGLSWARNCGLREARGEIVAYIDDDEIADSHWLAELAAGYQAAPNVACVSGFILPAEIETQAQDWFEQFGGHSKGRGFKQRIFNNSTHRTQNPLFPAPPFGAGGNMSFKTDVLRRLGGFDVALGAGTRSMGAEDTAVFYDMIMAGYTVVMQPGAFVRHYHYRDYAGLRRQLYGYGVGITAFFTRALIKNPLRIFDMLAIVPKSLLYLFGPHSARSATMHEDYPRELNQIERRGMLEGPVAYLRSRWRARSLRGVQS